mgnify:CR=1 FL=1
MIFLSGEAKHVDDQPSQFHQFDAIDQITELTVVRPELRNQLQRTQVFDGIKQPRDFVFLDLKLPDVSGDEVYSQLKAIHPDLPIVVITGYPDSEILSRILSLGPLTVIKKPIEYEQLNRAVKQLGHKGATETAEA